MIQTIVDDCLRDGQFDDCDLTMRDLAIIVDSLERTVTTVFHHRIDYPGLRLQPRAAEAADAPRRRPRPRTAGGRDGWPTSQPARRAGAPARPRSGGPARGRSGPAAARRRRVDAGAPRAREVSVLFCGDRRMRTLNRRYRGKDGRPTCSRFRPGDGARLPRRHRDLGALRAPRGAAPRGDPLRGDRPPAAARLPAPAGLRPRDRRRRRWRRSRARLRRASAWPGSRQRACGGADDRARRRRLLLRGLPPLRDLRPGARPALADQGARACSRSIPSGRGCCRAPGEVEIVRTTTKVLVQALLLTGLLTDRLGARDASRCPGRGSGEAPSSWSAGC